MSPLSNSARTDFFRSLANPGKPVHLLYDREAPRATGWVDADVHARKAGDRVVNAATRVATPFLGAFVVTQQALARPGMKKISVLPAPFIGLVGGTFLGAAGFGFDALHVALHLSGAAGNALYAVGHNGFEALFEDARGIWRGADFYANQPALPTADATQPSPGVRADVASLQATHAVPQEPQS